MWIAIRCLREWEALRYDRTKTTRMQDTVEAAEEAVDGIKEAASFYRGQDIPPPSDEELRGWAKMQSDTEGYAAEAYPSTDINDERIGGESEPEIPNSDLYVHVNPWEHES